MAEPTRKSPGTEPRRALPRRHGVRVLLPLPLRPAPMTIALPPGMEAPPGSFVVVPLEPARDARRGLGRRRADPDAAGAAGCKADPRPCWTRRR